MRASLLLLLLHPAVPASAQSIVASAAPERVAVTVYRDPNRGLAPFNLEWLGGYALVSETRRVRLPAGESELRFEGVTSGIVPQSAIVTGLGPAVLEKNRDARLLSPGALLDAYLGARLTLRRTSKETGAVREQEAIVRSTADGVVIQTAQGIEALRCTGFNETLVAPTVPADLSAKPTLSVRVRSPQPVETDVTLSYLTNNFDWQADYIAELSPSGDRISLFGWMTVANGDDTGLADAATQAVAGKLNYQRVEVPRGDAPPIRIQCWPQGTTSDIPLDEAAQYATGEDIMVVGGRMAPPPPPPPPPPAPERGGGDEFVAQQERLGDVRLYRVPIEVTVAAKSQKQVALLRKENVPVKPLFVLASDVFDGEDQPRPATMILQLKNNLIGGLGIPLPQGRVVVFEKSKDRRLLVGEATLDDKTIGEDIELEVGNSSSVFGSSTQIEDANGWRMRFVLTNAQPRPAMVEVRMDGNPNQISAPSHKLLRRNGKAVWRVLVPANGSETLNYYVRKSAVAGS